MHNEQYNNDLANIVSSGPHTIGDEQRDFNRIVWNQVQDIVPFSDIHKRSDCDLIYRFLIANRWKVDPTVSGLRNYIKWRTENEINTLLWETFPEELDCLKARFKGLDREGHPVYYDRPDPQQLRVLLQKVPRELIVRAHLCMMEQCRRLCKMHNTDRVTCVLDCSLVSMGIIANPSAMGILKEMSKLDQTVYPENMRTMLICNAPWAFSTLWRVIRPLLDERVQKKIQFVSGAKMGEDIDRHILLNQVPPEFGGTAQGGYINLLSEVQTLPPGTPVPTEKPLEQPALPAVLPAKEPLRADHQSPDEFADVEFHSLPSEDDTDSTHTGPEVTDECALSEPPIVTYKGPLVIQLEVTVSPSGMKKTLGIVDGKPIAQTSGGLIVSVDSGEPPMLFGELIVENGHPLHTFLIVADEKRIPHFILKRRNFHNEIQIFKPSAGTKLVVKSKMKVYCEGERSHILTCRIRPGATDKRDWHASFHKQSKDTSIIEKRGCTLIFSEVIQSESLQMLFALGIALNEVWYFGDE